MKVLLQGRIDLLERFGGDTTLITDIKNAFSQQEVDANLNTDKIADFDKYDLIHFFGIMRINDLYPYFLQAKKQHKKIVVTPIYEDLSYLDNFGRTGWEKMAKILPGDLKEFVKGLIRGVKDSSQLKLAVLQLVIPYSRQQKNLLKYSNRIISTSRGESILLQNKFSLPKSKFDVILIGIDKESTKVDKNDFINKYNLRNFILSVGRIEPKKNQLGLLEALKNETIPLVFIGRLSEYHSSYGKQFLKTVRKYSHVYYLGQLNRQMLLSAYGAAKVHVLPSWFEVMGITSMEAAINGCNVVTTDKGYTREYFKDLAWYCNPQDSESIRRSVIEAYYQPVKKGLKELVEEKYTWDKIVPKILEVYKDALKK